MRDLGNEVVRIGPCLFYIEKFITQFKTTEKNDRSPYSFLTCGYAKRRNGFLLGLRYANVSLAHSGVESS